MTTLRGSIGRVLSAVLPEIVVSACIPDDPYRVCRCIVGTDCYHLYNRCTYYQCHNDCTGAEYCYELGCC